MEENNKSKKFMLFGLIALVITIAVSSTYAYYVWTTSDNEVTKIVAGVGSATVTFDGGSDINASLRPVSDKSKGIVKEIKVKADTTGLTFNMYLDITSIATELKDVSFRYEFYKRSTKLKEGNFSDTYLNSNTTDCSTNSTKHITLLTGESIGTTNSVYTLYIWIDGANYVNPSTMMGKEFNFKLHADGTDAVLTSKADITLERLNNLNSTITLDTEHTPDFSTVSGNSGVKYDSNNVVIAENLGDGTKGIYVAEDDFGKSYYFRGAVENNYVKFGTYSQDLYYGKDSNSNYVTGTSCDNIPTECKKLASTGDSMYWRIIRINGDGSIRMIYDGTKAYANGSSERITSNIGYSVYNTNSNDNAYVGYMYGTAGASTYEETHRNTNNSTIKTYIDNWYRTYLSNYTDYLQDSIYCNDRSITPVDNFLGMELTGNGIGTTLTAYSDLTRNIINSSRTPSLKCTNINDRFTVDTSNGNGALTYPIGLITSDELVLSGGGNIDFSNFEQMTRLSDMGFYLYMGDLVTDDYYFWSMTPTAFFMINTTIGIVAYVDGSSMGNVFPDARGVSIETGGSNITNAIKPVISLKPDTITGGDGTMNNPFTVE